MKNFYKILGVHEHAKPDEIKKTYRQLSLKFHPDKNNGSEESTERFKQINEAYEHLFDNDKRIQHDQALAAIRQQEKIAAEMKAQQARKAEEEKRAKMHPKQQRSSNSSGAGMLFVFIAVIAVFALAISFFDNNGNKA